MTEQLQIQPEDDAAAKAAADKAALEKFDQEPGEQPPEGGDELIAGKFKSQEDLIAAYQELERKQSAAGEEPPKEEPTGDDEPEQGEFDFNSIQAEFLEKGEISAETLAAAEKAGFSKDAVDLVTSGIKAQVEAARAEVTAVAGGEEEFQELTTWATANIEPADLQKYNDAVDAGDMATVKDYVKAFRASYEEVNGVIGKREKGVPGSKAAGSYESRAQMTKDMADPRYKSDPAFRKQVEQKIANSNIL